MWPTLPGLCVGVIARQSGADDMGMWIASGVITLAMLCSLILLGMKGRYGFLMASLIALVISCITSWMAYGAYMM